MGNRIVWINQGGNETGIPRMKERESQAGRVQLVDWKGHKSVRGKEGRGGGRVERERGMRGSVRGWC